MDASITALMARAEQPDASVELQHVLIAFKGSGVPTATRTKEEAKKLAEQVYAEAIGGADFLGLVKKYTDDSAPGIYPMTKASRAGLVQAFGDVGFRLKAGEIGVAGYDPTVSPFGWHIIKRLK
ncbi:MAG: peptidylprolyl isomerase [Planctomycetota bacterium]